MPVGGNWLPILFTVFGRCFAVLLSVCVCVLLDLRLQGVSC
jgi:hypothetical protein